MIIGEDLTIRRDDEARAGPLLPFAGPLTLREAPAEEALKKVFSKPVKGIVGGRRIARVKGFFLP